MRRVSGHVLLVWITRKYLNPTGFLISCLFVNIRKCGACATSFSRYEFAFLLFVKYFFDFSFQYVVSSIRKSWWLGAICGEFLVLLLFLMFNFEEITAKDMFIKIFSVYDQWAKSIFNNCYSFISWGPIWFTTKINFIRGDTCFSKKIMVEV